MLLKALGGILECQQYSPPLVFEQRELKKACRTGLLSTLGGLTRRFHRETRDSVTQTYSRYPLTQSSGTCTVDNGQC
jgi:hypothetical protein